MDAESIHADVKKDDDSQTNERIAWQR